MTNFLFIARGILNNKFDLFSTRHREVRSRESNLSIANILVFLCHLSMMLRIFPHFLIGAVRQLITALEIVGVEKFVGLMPQRLLQEDFIYFLNRRAFMGLPISLHRSIILIQSTGSQGADFVVGGNGLPAAGNAASGTAHDFDEGVIGLAFPDFIHHLAGIA